LLKQDSKIIAGINIGMFSCWNKYRDILMLAAAGSIFEHFRNNLASIAAQLRGNGIVRKCDGSCLCVDGTVIRDGTPERDGCVRENDSEKGAIGTVCDAGAYLPEDAASGGTVFDHDFGIGPGRNRGANLKYVDAFPTECQNTSGRDHSRRVELVHAWSKCPVR